jgi:hypothetical protein
MRDFTNCDIEVQESCSLRRHHAFAAGKQIDLGSNGIEIMLPRKGGGIWASFALSYVALRRPAPAPKSSYR